MLRRALVCVLVLGACVAAALCGPGFSAFSSTTRAEPATFAAAAVFAPRSTTAPTISGTAQDGAALSGTDGSWARTPSSLARRWLRCDPLGAGCAAIADATASTYQVQGADVGHALRLEVTAANAGGSARAVSEPTRAVAEMDPPVSITAPAISGTAQVGSQLTATGGTWAGSVTTYAFAWLRCGAPDACIAIPGATGATYAPVLADADATLRVRVTAANPGGAATATSAPTAAVAGAPVSIAAPALSGIAAVGQTLTASDGSWAGATPMTYAYAWSRCDATGAACAPIPGATAAAYTATQGDLGSRLLARVTASNAAGTATAASVAGARVGTAYDGRVLADDPAAYFTFERTGATVVDDSGHGFTGAFTSPASAAGAIAGSAASASFAGGYVTLPANLVSGSTGFTWEGWISEDCCIGRLWQRVFDFGSRAGDSFWLTTDYGDGAGWFAAFESASVGRATAVAPWQGLGRWVHVAVTSTRGATRIYLDGALAASSASGLVPSDLAGDANNWLGRSQYPSDPLFAGRMDDVAVYNRALSAAQVAAHFAAR